MQRQRRSKRTISSETRAKIIAAKKRKKGLAQYSFSSSSFPYTQKLFIFIIIPFPIALSFIPAWIVISIFIITAYFYLKRFLFRKITITRQMLLVEKKAIAINNISSVFLDGSVGLIKINTLGGEREFKIVVSHFLGGSPHFHKKIIFQKKQFMKTATKLLHNVKDNKDIQIEVIHCKPLLKFDNIS